MVTIQTTSRALRQFFSAFCIFLFCVYSTSFAAQLESAIVESSNQIRPSIALLSLGLQFSTPAGWTAEDYPQLNGVLLLSPAANDAPKSSWRTRILVEIGKPQSASDLSSLAANNAVSILGPGTQWREVARRTVRHAQGFDYGRVETTQVREPHAIRDWRIVIKPKSSNELIVITLSCARALWDIERSGFEAFIDQLKLR